MNLGSGDWKLHLGHLDPKDVFSHKSRTLAPIFTSRGLFYPESKVNPVRLPNYKKYLDLEVWGWETKVKPAQIPVFFKKHN